MIAIPTLGALLCALTAPEEVATCLACHGKPDAAVTLSSGELLSLRDLVLELIDAGVRLDHVGREPAVALHHRLDGTRELGLGKTAHLGDRVVEPAQLLVVALDDVFGDHLRSALDQPKRPVM